MMGDLRPDLARRVADAKAHTNLAELIGQVVKLRRQGREHSGLCPFHDEKSPSFTVVPEKGFYHCFGCGAHGDALRFLQDYRGIDFIDALQELEAGAGLSPDAQSASPRRESVRRDDDRDADLVTSTEAGVFAWTHSRHARGTIVETYLRARGIDPRATGVLDVVRFNARCPVSLWRRGGSASMTAPAMIAPIARVEDRRRFVQQGVHVTYLAADGRGKAKLPSWTDRQGNVQGRPSRKIWGDAGLGCVPIPPVFWEDWRDGSWIDDSGEMVVGEGLESTLSLAERVRGVRGALATLSLGNLQGHWIENGPKLDGAHSLTLWNLRGDPDRPAFTVPDAGRVAIGVDADMKGLTNRRVQERPRGPAVRRDLTGEERMTICGQLAAQAWKRAGAGRVRVLRPHAGRDFNDEAMEAA